MAPLSARSPATFAAASCRGGDAGRDADAVVRRAADREARQPLQLARGPGDPVEVADGVLRQRAAPPLHVRVDRPDREPDRVARGRASASSTSSSSVRWSGLLLAVAAERAAQQDHRVLGGRTRLADPVPLGEGERRRLDRTSVDRRHQEAGAGRPRGTPRAGKASVTMAIEAYSIRASSSAAAGATSLSSRARGPAGVARTTASACDHLRVPGRADDEAPATPGPAGEVADRGAGADRRAATRATSSVGQPTHSAPRPAKTGAAVESGGGVAAAAACVSERSCVEQRHELGHGGPGGDLAGVAGVHPAEQRLHQPVDDLLAEPLLDEVADADVAVAELGRRQHRVQRRPGQPLRRQHVRRAPCRSSGTPISVRGIGTSRPRFQRLAEMVAGCTRSSPSPTSGPGRPPRAGG